MLDNEFNPKYNKIFNDVNNIGEIVKIEDFFNEKEMEAVVEYRKNISNNKENPDWIKKIKSLASEYPALTQEIFLNPNSPQKLISDLIITTKYSWLFHDALKRHLPDADYEYIALYRKKDINAIVDESIKYSNGKERLLKHFHPCFINFLYAKHNDMFPPQLANFTTDDLYVYDALYKMKNGEGKELSEDELGYIVGNVNLSDDVREKAFELGCNYFIVDNFPKSIINNVYESCVELVFDTKKEDIENLKYYEDAKSLLNKMVVNRMLPVDKESDLYKRSFASKDDELKRYVNTIAKNSNYESIISEILVDRTKLNTNESKRIYLALAENKNLSDSNVKVLSMLMQPYSMTRETARNSINENMRAHILFLEKLKNTNDAFYNPYFKAEHFGCIKTIAKNPETSVSVLKRIATEKFPPDELKVIAILNYCSQINYMQHMFQPLQIAFDNPFQLSLAQHINNKNSLNKFNELCDSISCMLSDLKSKHYLVKMEKIKENVNVEYEQYRILNKYKQHFYITKESSVTSFMCSFELTDTLKNHKTIPKSFETALNEMSIDMIGNVKNVLAKELHDYIYVEKNDAEFYAKIDKYTNLYNLCDDVIKKRVAKEKTEELSEVAQMANSMTENDKEEFCKRIEGAQELWIEPSQEEMKLYNFLKENEEQQKENEEIL